jgi:LacI family repressor for deo operon, udp, cdd, tsx, nupC, and nupG
VVFKSLSNNLPEALFVTEDDAAYNMLEACSLRGIRVPEDMALIGFDDEKPARYFNSSLSTIHHPFTEKGVEAVKILTGLMDGTLDRNKVHQKILKPHLVVRKTCGTK